MFSINEWKSTANIRWDPMDQLPVESRDFTECARYILLDSGEKLRTKKHVPSEPVFVNI